MEMLVGTGIGRGTIGSRRQLFLLPSATRSQFNPSISIKLPPQFQSQLRLQLSTNQTLTVVSALGDGSIDGETERSSPLEVKKEIQRCYRLVHRLGRGTLYIGSSRVKPDHPHYLLTLELSREVAKMLDCTTWTGAGPGLMDAAIKGSLQAKKPVGGFKIGKEAGEWTSSNLHPYLPPDTYFTCRFFSARKHGLVDAVVRNDPSERTAVVALPGGIGTVDEIFEILALIQLERIGSKFPVPFLLLNYDGYYTKLMEFLDVCEQWGTVARGEVDSLWTVCNSNFEALEFLAEFYGISECKRNYDIGKYVNQGTGSYI
ncbi:hypothetical protein LUZ63_014423 [Rhynchospora breviuscula]|uniref:Cytokinin riboside 5'-monophosphate phosphoribohydrolase n=1 Tax=Rhynchospora breviuscula TaxID=2022672 RepID=A0A9Q0HLM8_9POAL|nr:hypothetical protein LUZ63_014423 [Rhynchospora breviuscula]